MRSALRYGITPRTLIAMAGADERIDRPGQFAAVVSRHAKKLALALGCPVDDVRRAVRCIHPNTALSDYVGRYKGIRRAVLAGCSYCPQCLAGPNPRWKRQWSNVFAFACIEHSCLLVRACPRCGETPWSTTAWLSNLTNSLWHCGIRRPGAPNDRARTTATHCNHDLRTVEIYELDPHLIRAQQFIADLCQRYLHAPNSTIAIAGVEATATIAFDALCELLNESLGILTLFTAGPDRTKLTTALRDCYTILSARTVIDAAHSADDVGLLNPGGPTTPIGPDNVFLRRPRNPLLAAIRIRALSPSLSPTTQLTLSCGNRWPRYPIRENQDDRTWLRLPEHHPKRPEPTAAWVPQVLWSSAIWRNGTVPAHVEAAAQAMALAKIGDIRPWKLIALELGLPKDMATPVTRYWRQVVRTGRWDEALAALTTLREQLRRQPPPIDYQLRRIIADDPTRLTTALRKAGYTEPIEDHAEVGDVLRRFWEHFAGGEIAYAPPPYGLPAARIQGWHLRAEAIDRDHSQCFQAAYECMTHSDGLRPQGPLTWRPP